MEWYLLYILGLMGQEETGLHHSKEGSDSKFKKLPSGEGDKMQPRMARAAVVAAELRGNAECCFCLNVFIPPFLGHSFWL